MPDDLRSIFSDSDFISLSPQARRATLRQLIPELRTSPDKTVDTFANAYGGPSYQQMTDPNATPGNMQTARGAPVTNAYGITGPMAPRPGETFEDVFRRLASPNQITGISAQPKPAQTFGERLRAARNPGSFEGHPENIGEYVPQSVGQMASAITEAGKGNFAVAGHKMISGAGNAMLPAAPFVGAAAPGAMVLGTAGGLAGGYGAKSTAQALGANPDQVQLAEDFGNLLGGYLGGMTTPKIKAGIAKASYNPDGTLTPLADAALHPTKLPEATFRKIFAEPPSYPGASLPSAEEFYANKAADLMKRQIAQNILDRAAAREAKAAQSARSPFERPPANPQGTIVSPSSQPPGVKRTFQSIPGEDLLPMVVKGDRGAILEWQRRGLSLPEGVGFMVESNAANRAYSKK